MTPAGAGLLAGGLVGLAVLLGQGAPLAAARRRLAGALGQGTRQGPGPGRGADAGRPTSWRAGRLLAVAPIAVALGFVLGGPAGAVAAGAGLAASAWRVLGAQRRRLRRRRLRIAADLPGAADLFAACLAAGSAPAEAAEAVAEAIGGPIGEALRRVVALLRLGGEPARCWVGLGADPGLAALGRAVARAVDSGTSLAPVVAAEAAQCRLARRLAAESALARVGVHAAAPLGLCFLPAFVLIGIVPVVTGLAAAVLT